MCADRVEARVAPNFEHAEEQKPYKTQKRVNDAVFARHGCSRRRWVKNVPAMRAAQTMTSTLATMFRAW